MYNPFYSKINLRMMTHQTPEKAIYASEGINM